MISAYRHFALISIFTIVLTGCAAHKHVPPSDVGDIEEISSYDSELVTTLIKNTKHAKQKALFIFDVDNTLLKANDFFGSDQWYEWVKIMKTEGSENYPLFTAPKCVFDIQALSYTVGHMTVTEEALTPLLHKLKRSNIDIMGLTARSPKLRNATERELENNQVQFTLPVTLQEELNIELKPYPCKKGSRGCSNKGLFEKTRPVSYENGLIMASGQNKGYVLQQFLTEQGLIDDYDTVVLFDDKMKNISQFSQSFKNHPIKAHAFFYTQVQEFLGDQLPETDKHRAIEVYNDLLKLVPALGDHCQI